MKSKIAFFLCLLLLLNMVNGESYKMIEGKLLKVLFVIKDDIEKENINLEHYIITVKEDNDIAILELKIKPELTKSWRDAHPYGKELKITVDLTTYKIVNIIPLENSELDWVN